MVIEIKDKNLYYVGGVVRDEILGVQSFDTDFCYEGNAIEFAKQQGFQILRENPDFGTVRVLVQGKEVDIASTRTEKYPQKGHLPIVDIIGCSLKDDLARRDFTINALAKNTVTGEIIDYFNGLEDLKNKKIRVLHDESFIDDPTRIIRALKFSVRFDFDLDDHTKYLQDEYLKNINYDMCYHRIKKELKETFNLNSLTAYDKFIEQGIYKLLGNQQKYITPNVQINKLIEKYKPTYSWLLYLATFDLSNIELTKEENCIVQSFYKINDIVLESDFDTFKLFEKLPLDSILLYAIYTNKDLALKYLVDLKKIKLELNGNDLKALGIKQGKIYSEIFDNLLKQRILGKISTKQDEVLFVKNNFL